MDAKMDELVELPDTTGCIGNTDGEIGKDYEIPYTSKIEETEYMTIKSIAESSPSINECGSGKRCLRAFKPHLSDLGPSNPRLSHDTVDVTKYLTEMTALKKKINIFCTILLTLLVIVSVTSGVLIYKLMMQTDTADTKSDEMQAQIGKLQDKPGEFEDNAKSMQLVQTKLMEIETKLDTNTANTDMHLSKISKLEKDSSSQSTMIQDHAMRITNLESKALENYNIYEKLKTNVSSLEIDIAIAQSTKNALNDTLTKLSLNVSTNDEKIKEQQIRINEMGSDKGVDNEELQALNATIQTHFGNVYVALVNHSYELSQLEKDISSHTLLIQNHTLRITHLESSTTTNQKLETKISSLKSDMTTYETNMQRFNVTLINHSSKLSQLERDRSSHTSLIHDNSLRITKLESNTTTNRNNHQKLETKVSSLESDIITYATNMQGFNLSLVIHSIKLSQLEKDRSSHTSLIHDNSLRITQLESNSSTYRNNYQKLEAKVESLESHRTTYDTNMQRFNVTLINHSSKLSQLERNISSHSTLIQTHSSLIQDHAFRITHLESSTTDSDNNYQKLETKVSSHSSLIQNHTLWITQLETNISSLETNQQSIKKIQDTKSAFLMYDQTPTYNTTIGILTHPTAQLNIGGRHKTSGKFVCKNRGIYVFVLNLYRGFASGSRVRCYMRKNGSNIAYANAPKYTEEAYNGGSGSAVVHLEPGDTVYVGDCVGTDNISSLTSFMGFLLQAD